MQTHSPNQVQTMDQAGLEPTPSTKTPLLGAAPGAPSRRRGHRLLALGAATSLLLAGCSSESSDLAGPATGVGNSDFAVAGASVLNGVVWQLNRPIDVTFNEDIDFGTVSLSTIQIVDSQGVPAVGSFTQPSPRVIRFQPVCPDNEDNTNGGFLQGRSYRLTVPSETSQGIGGGVTVQNTAGERLESGLNIAFTTPLSSDPLVLFVDVVAGPPQIRVRGLNGVPLTSTSSSYVEYPGRSAPNDRSFFEFNTGLQQGRLPNGELVPLNLYSDTAEQFALVLQFNQPIFAASTNVNSQRIGLEYLDVNSQVWNRVPSAVELLSNCTSSGASVRLTPRGIVPQGAEMRAVIREGFSDLTGDRVPATLTSFARVVADVADPLNPVVNSRDDGADEILELFDVGGDAPGSLEDASISSPNPRATWSSEEAPGVVQGSFDFSGTGGPGGDFDWVIPINETVILNTDADTILGGPGGVLSNQQAVIGGIVNVRDLIVEPGANLTIVGSNTATILATRNVIVRGSIRVEGGDNPGVGTLNTTDQPEVGAAGGPGGGSGGTGSFRTSSSTPRGGPGFGPFNSPGGGGIGGETGYSIGGICAKEDRRGAGGGGGRFGRDIRYLVNGNLRLCQTLVGMDVEPGFLGSLDGTGAVSQNAPAQGGDPGPFPFVDANDLNDFFGTAILANGDQVLGELTSVIGGSGGGGGGDAVSSFTFPLTPFSRTADEKGCGGGGGGGGLEILAIGDVSLLGEGSISADGGTGNGGENTNFFDRIGGGSGGGSGGHIVISTAGNIIIESEISDGAVGPFYSDQSVNSFNAAFIHEKRPLRALGGQGGCGRESFCGASQTGEKTWAADAIPLAAFEGDPTIPPQDVPGWVNSCNRVDTDCASPTPVGTLPGAGGDGGPGIIQLHVADPRTQIQFPNQVGVYGGDPDPVNDGQVVNSIDPTFSMAPPPFGWSTPTTPVDRLLPFFSARSEVFSDWIPLGLARTNPDGLADEQVLLGFQGTNPATGEVLREGGVGTTFAELDALVDYGPISIGGALPSGDADLASVTFAEGAIDSIYLSNPSLMREFVLRLRDGDSPVDVEEFIVQSASYDAVAQTFTVIVDPRGDAFREQLEDASIINPEVELVPFFFRLEAGGVTDAYPVNTSIRILFDATVANPTTGLPSTVPTDVFSEGNVSNFTPDITLLNDPNDVWDFIRVKFEFNINAGGGAISQEDIDRPRPGLSYFRIPYTF